MCKHVYYNDTHEYITNCVLVFFRHYSERVDYRKHYVSTNLVEYFQLMHQWVFKWFNMTYVTGCKSGQTHRDSLLKKDIISQIQASSSKNNTAQYKDNAVSYRPGLLRIEAFIRSSKLAFKFFCSPFFKISNIEYCDPEGHYSYHYRNKNCHKVVQYFKEALKQCYSVEIWHI